MTICNMTTNKSVALVFVEPVVCGRGRLVRTQTIQESLCLFSFLTVTRTKRECHTCTVAWYSAVVSWYG